MTPLYVVPSEISDLAFAEKDVEVIGPEIDQHLV